MKLIYLDPDGVSSSMVFPKVGYWKHKEIKEIDHPQTIRLLLTFPQINKYEEPKKTRRKPEKTEFNKTVEEAVEGIETFYEHKTEETEEEGGED